MNKLVVTGNQTNLNTLVMLTKRMINATTLEIAKDSV